MYSVQYSTLAVQVQCGPPNVVHQYANPLKTNFWTVAHTAQ